MKAVILAVACVMCLAAGPATVPSEEARLKDLVARLQALVADLKDENARLRKQMAARSAPLSKSPFDDYAKQNDVSPELLDKMRRFTPAAGMSERDLDFMVETQNRLSRGGILARKLTMSETTTQRTVRYTLYRPTPLGWRLIMHDAVLIDGAAEQVSLKGEDDIIGGSIGQGMQAYIKSLGE